MRELEPMENRPTPTQYDLARWMIERIIVLEGEPKNRVEYLELMSEVLSCVRSSKPNAA